MGGMPIFEVGNWLHQATAFYAVAVPTFFYINNFLGPRVMEPVFCRDYLMAKFEKISASSSVSANATSFTPSSGLAPKIPKNVFVRGGRHGKTAGCLMAIGMMAFTKPVQRDR